MIHPGFRPSIEGLALPEKSPHGRPLALPAQCSRMAPVNERTTVREWEASPRHPGGGPRASLAPRFLLNDACRVECDDPARVVVPSDQWEPKRAVCVPDGFAGDPFFSSHAPLLLDNGCRAEFDATHWKQTESVHSTRQYQDNEAFQTGEIISPSREPLEAQ